MATIFFDMDGTIANLYGYENWLTELRAENPRPYKIAKPLVNFAHFAKILKKLQKNGYNIGIISWGSKNASDSYDKMVHTTKVKWLKKHLPSVTFNEIHIAHYGTPKSTFAHSVNDILFDDELNNRLEWRGKAYDEKNLLAVLRSLT